MAPGRTSGSGKRRSPSRGFYQEALSEAERILLEEARQVEGLDEEIALLRLRLSQLLREKPEQTDLLLREVALLVRAVATRYRVSKKAEEDLYQNVLGVLQGIGEALLPEGLDGGGQGADKSA